MSLVVFLTPPSMEGDCTFCWAQKAKVLGKFIISNSLIFGVRELEPGKVA